MLLCPCMLLGRRHYINSRYDHFSFIHKHIRKWINIYWVCVLFNTPCDLPGLATATQDLVLRTFKSKSNQKKKKKKDHESLVSDWLSLMGKKEKGWKIRPCVSSCSLLLQDGWKRDVLAHIGLRQLRTWDGNGVSMENRARSQGKGTFEGKASRLPSNKLRESGHKTMKKETRQELKVKT